MKQYVSRDDQAVRHMAKCLGMDPHKDKPLLWIARSALEAPLPEGWSQAEAEDGARYFYHAESGTTSWQLPSDEQYRLLFEQKKAERLRVEGGFGSGGFAMTARDGSIATRRGFQVTGLSSVGGSVAPTPPGSSRSNRGRTPPMSARSAASSSRESRPPSSGLPTPRSGTPRGTPSPRANTAHMRAVNARVAPRDLLQAPAWQRELLQRAQTTIAQRAISAPGGMARGGAGGAAAQGRGDRPYTAEAPTWGAAPPPPAWEVWAAAQDAAAEAADAAAGGGGASRASSPRGAVAAQHREAAPPPPPPPPQGPRTKEQQRARQVHYEDLVGAMLHEKQQLDSACRLKAQQLQELGEQIVEERKAADALVSDAMASGDDGDGNNGAAGGGGAKKRNAIKAACAESAPSGPPAWRAPPLPSAGEKGKFLMRIDATLLKRRADLQSQLGIVEERMGDLAAYTEALMAAIDLLRERRKEFLAQVREQVERSDKMEKDLRALQGYVYEELNQRERAVRQLRRHREEAAVEQAEQEHLGRALIDELGDEERRAHELHAEADVAEQLHRQDAYVRLRGARVRSEAAGVKYGYVANQVSGWRAEFDQMLHAAQVRARQHNPNDAMSAAMQMAAQLVAAYQSNEVRNTSLLGRLIDTLNPQQALLGGDIASLDEAEAALLQAASDEAKAAAASAAANGESGEQQQATPPAESPPASPTRSPSPSRPKSKLGGSANLARFGASVVASSSPASPRPKGRRNRSVSRDDVFRHMTEPSQAPHILGGANYARTGQLNGGGVGPGAAAAAAAAGGTGGGGVAQGDGAAAALRKLEERLPGLLPGTKVVNRDEQIEHMDADVIAALLADLDRPLRQLVTLTTVTPATEAIAQLRAQHGCGDLAALPDKHGLQILEPSLGSIHQFVDMLRLHGAWLVGEGRRREAEQHVEEATGDEAEAEAGSPDAEDDRRGRRAGQGRPREVLSGWCAAVDPEAATVEPIELGKHVRHTLKKLSVHRGPTEGDEEEAEEEFYQRLQQISELKPRGASESADDDVGGGGGAGGGGAAAGVVRRRWGAEGGAAGWDGASPIAEEVEQAEASSRDTGVVGMMREATGPSAIGSVPPPAPAIGGDALLPGASLQQGELV